MRKSGDLLVCDRCGKAVLLEFGPVSEDGKPISEPPPDGWVDNFRVNSVPTFGPTLCPLCARNLEITLKNFLKTGKKWSTHF